MFNLSQKYAVDRPILQWYNVLYTPPSLNLLKGEIIEIFLLNLEKKVLFP